MKESAKAAAKQADAAKAVTDRAADAAKAATDKAADVASEFFGAAKNLSFEVPAAVREFAERGVRQVKESYDRFKTVAEETTDVLEDTYATVTKGVTEVNLKALEAAKDNTDATFDLARDLVNVKSFAEVIELQTAYVRRRFEAGIAQSKEIAALVNQVANDSVRPVREGFEKSMEQWKPAAV